MLKLRKRSLLEAGLGGADTATAAAVAGDEAATSAAATTKGDGACSAGAPVAAATEGDEAGWVEEAAATTKGGGACSAAEAAASVTSAVIALLSGTSVVLLRPRLDIRKTIEYRCSKSSAFRKRLHWPTAAAVLGLGEQLTEGPDAAHPEDLIQRMRDET